MNSLVKFVLLSVFVVTFTTEAMAQRRGNRGGNNGVRSGGRASRTVTRRPNNPRRTSAPRRANSTRRQAPARTNRSNSYRNPRNNRPVVRNNRLNRPNRPALRNNRRNIVRNNRPGFRNNHRTTRVPFRHNRRNVNHYRHANRRFARANSYYGFLRRNNSNFFHRNWVLFPTIRGNGFFLSNSYPYFVFNGYQHRYSAYDRCNYELVDGYNNTTVQSFYGQMCNVGYNQCAQLRDNLNHSEYSSNYYCAENFRY